MNLIDLKEHIEKFPNGTEFKFGLSKPFSWRGSYDEVAFAIVEQPMSREEIMDKINLAYSETFQGYKGGDFKYNHYTPIHFEESIRDYSDGDYSAKFISKIEGSDLFKSQEHRLIYLAFSA